MTELATPLQTLLAKAGRVTAPAAVDRYRPRLESGSGAAILADVSGSMAELAGSRPKIELLREALVDVLASHPDARLIAFASRARVCTPTDLPAPGGGTNLAGAIDTLVPAAPALTIVISDGQPDAAAAALTAAARLTGVIHTLYCGRDDDAAAIAFMRRLARLGAGSAVVHDLRRVQRALAQPLRALMAPTTRGGQR